ncbi:MAG TPA: hypothetical protein VGQ99_04795 [Tepidisphaeraceae bacterium]|jgi:hypothetical protein|nr:hypothetical protein [Tepidisphaeraceae bacterium]
MADTVVTSTAPVKDQGDTTDLSEEIVKAVEKLPDDRVTCRRIFGNSYRCNWWSAADRSKYDNPGMSGQLVTTHTIRQSRFLNVTRGATGLVITEPEARASN